MAENSDWWPEDVELPAVNKLSDVMYIEWATQAGADVATLQYVIQLNAMNKDLRRVMNLAMQADGWSEPGTFYQVSRAYQALLGCPNGNPQAWALINHKTALGLGSTVLRSGSVVNANGNNQIDDEAIAKEREMCWVEEEGYFGLCQHILFTFEDVPSSDVIDLSSSDNDDIMDLS
ncbi:hypothetical protein N7486_009923 [Penicillium sp. IBT 16267x]|nr:hypothetical protein N7486_009923 [Penicillium sp. IBT 16267x]